MIDASVKFAPPLLNPLCSFSSKNLTWQARLLRRIEPRINERKNRFNRTGGVKLKMVAEY